MCLQGAAGGVRRSESWHCADVVTRWQVATAVPEAVGYAVAVTETAIQTVCRRQDGPVVRPVPPIDCAFAPLSTRGKFLRALNLGLVRLAGLVLLRGLGRRCRFCAIRRHSRLRIKVYFRPLAPMAGRVRAETYRRPSPTGSCRGTARSCCRPGCDGRASNWAVHGSAVAVTSGTIVG